MFFLSLSSLCVRQLASLKEKLPLGPKQTLAAVLFQGRKIDDEDASLQSLDIPDGALLVAVVEESVASVAVELLPSVVPGSYVFYSLAPSHRVRKKSLPMLHLR